MRRTPDWRTPALLLASLLFGIVFGLAQHFFYTWLNGRATDGTETPFSQNLAVGLGTAFAFIVKASFVLCVSIAYHQLMWRRLHMGAIKGSSIDALNGALDDITSFGDVKLWFRSPLLLLAAILTWLIPIAAVVAPSSLTTRWSTDMRQRYELVHVPQPDFNRTTFGIDSIDLGDMRYVGPTTALQRIATTVAIGGSMLDIPSPGLNSSYSQTFDAPSLVCSNGSAEFYRQYNYTKGWLFDEDHPASIMNIIVFAAWSRSTSPVTLSSSEFMGSAETPAGALVFLLNSTADSWKTYTLSYETPSSIYFAMGYPNLDYDFDETSKLWQCSLYNASYNLDVTTSNGLQIVNVKNKTLLGPITPAPYVDDLDNNSTRRRVVANQATLEAFANIIDGSILRTSKTMDIVNYFVTATDVMDTSLALNVEFYPTLQRYHNVQRDAVLSAPINQTFADAVEELFQNITFSLMSSELFTIPASELDDTPLTNVTFSEPYITYHYQPRNLAIAYLLCAVAAALFFVLGEALIFSSGKSYTTKFTTIMRATTGPAIDRLIITDRDRDGADPLPPHIAKANIQLSASASAPAGTGTAAASPEKKIPDVLVVQPDGTATNPASRSKTM